MSWASKRSNRSEKFCGIIAVRPSRDIEFMRRGEPPATHGILLAVVGSLPLRWLAASQEASDLMVQPLRRQLIAIANAVNSAHATGTSQGARL